MHGNACTDLSLDFRETGVKIQFVGEPNPELSERSSHWPPGQLQGCRSAPLLTAADHANPTTPERSPSSRDTRFNALHSIQKYLYACVYHPVCMQVCGGVGAGTEHAGFYNKGSRISSSLSAVRPVLKLPDRRSRRREEMKAQMGILRCQGPS